MERQQQNLIELNSQSFEIHELQKRFMPLFYELLLYPFSFMNHKIDAMSIRLITQLKLLDNFPSTGVPPGFIF